MNNLVAKKLDYDINYAISIRNKTIGDIGLGYENPSHTDDIIDFRSSAEIARLDFSMPDIPIHYDMGINDERNITKKQWRKRYRSYRIYLKGDYECEY